MKKKQKEVFVSVDVETDGPIPADHSMLSLGGAAFDEDGKLLSTFSANLELLPGATPHPDTMRWWSENQAAFDQTRQNLQDPKVVMENFVKWVEGLPGKPVCICFPAGFDFTFLYWHMIHFVARSPFSFSALDIKSFVSAVLKLPFRECSKKNMPKRWFSKSPHTHIATDDAIEQGELFMNIRKEHLEL